MRSSGPDVNGQGSRTTVEAGKIREPREPGLLERSVRTRGDWGHLVKRKHGGVGVGPSRLVLSLLVVVKAL